MADKTKGFILGLCFAVLGVGLAYAQPSPTGTEEPLVEPSPTETVAPTPDVTEVPTPEPTESTVEEPEEEDTDEQEQEDGEAKDNHGAAVSTAAHCPIKGRAHGELVRSIAQDKDATVADAEAACAAALAELEEQASLTTEDTKSKPAKAKPVKTKPSGGPPPWAGGGKGKDKK